MTDDRDPGRSGRWLGAFVAAAAALVVYLVLRNVASYELVNYDDVYVVGPGNPAIAKGLVAGLPELLNPAARPRLIGEWLPFYAWSLGLDHAIGGGAAWIFHLHSALLHALCAAMVALIARRLGATTFVAALAGVIFAVHPLATESVAWVGSRKDVLSFAWMAAAAICYLDALEKKRPGLHLAGAAFLLVAMTAKGTTLVLPLLLGVHALLLRRDDASARRRLAPIVPYAIVAAAMTALHLWVALDEGTTGGSSSVAAAPGLAALLHVDLEVVCRYVAGLAAPFSQSVEHGVSPNSVDPALAFLGGVFAAVWIGAIVFAWKRSRVVAAVLLAVALALSPFNNILPKTSVLFAERYAFIALLPFSIGVAWLLRPRGDGPGSLLPAAIGVGVLGTLCVLRIPVWHDSTTLWADAARKAPASALVQSQLADAYGVAARAPGCENSAELNARAENAWRSAGELAQDDLAKLRAETGLATHLMLTANTAKDPVAQVKEAVARFSSAEASAKRVNVPGIDAQRVQILTNRATCEELLDDTAAAFADWQAATQLDANCARAWNALARIHLASGRAKEVKEAIAHSEKAVPHEPSIVRERAKIRLLAGDSGGARRDLAEAITAHPADAELLVDAARLDAMWLRPVDAEEKLRRALALRPEDAQIRELLAAALLDQAMSQASRDDMPAAREAARRAGEVAPKSSAPEQVLGIVARRAGDLEEAAQHLRRARDLHPEGVRIREQLASVLVELAARLFDEQRDALALLLVEEAVQARADAISTPKSRLDTGVGEWPEPVARDPRSTVARSAALKGLAYLAVGRAAEALPELVVAEAGTQGGDACLRRVTLRLLIRAQVLTGRFDDAVASARSLASLDVDGDAAWTWRRQTELADALIERGTSRRGTADSLGAAEDFAAARVALAAGSAAGMPEWRLHTRLGEVLFREEDFLGATKAFDHAESCEADALEPVLDRAQVWRTLYLQEEDKAYLLQAERDFRRAAEIAPSDPRVLAGLGETLLLEQKPGDAFPWLQKAVLADPSQAIARKLLADLAIRAGRSHLEKCSEIRSSRTKDEAALARAQQEIAEAKIAAERAVALDPPSPDALVFLGDVLRAAGDWTTPLAKYELARTRFPGTSAPADAIAKFHLDRGLFKLLYKRRAEAVADFRTAVDTPNVSIDVGPGRDRLHEIAVSAYGEAMDLDKAGKTEEAAERFELSLAAEPTAEGHFARGVLLVRLSKFDDAAAAYAAAIALNPKLLAARLNRAAALVHAGRFDDAAAEYREWQGVAPADDASRRSVERQLVWIDEQKRDIEGSDPK